MCIPRGALHDVTISRLTAPLSVCAPGNKPPSAETMLIQRLRRWISIGSALGGHIPGIMRVISVDGRGPGRNGLTGAGYSVYA